MRGTIVIYMPIYGGETSEFGELAGGGTLLMTGSGQSEDCFWTKAGEVDVEVSGKLESNDIIPDLNITLKNKWIYTQSIRCPEASWTQEISLDPEPTTFTIPLVDGHTITQTKTMQNVTITITYVLHVPKRN